MKFKGINFSIMGLVLALVAAVGLFLFTSAGQADAGGRNSAARSGTNTTVLAQTSVAPKYVFMFIGDGMSYTQLSVTSAYLGALEGEVKTVDLPMMKFPVAGSAATYDSTSFAPDSASTATSFATGYKTLSGVINMDETKTKKYEAITEKLFKQKGWKIGVVSSVNLNHATPSAYYGHQASRGNYYELSQELVNSGFEYFAGGKLLDNRKGSFDKLDVYADLRAKGYTVVTTTPEYKRLNAAGKKVAIFADDKDFSDDTGAMHYELDRPRAQPSLADYVRTGITTLDNDKGFFMMVEGGKVDWSAHANDAATVVNDVLAFSDAVQVAVDFYNRHPNETLIIVTGDHETGGLSIGFAGTGYDTHLDLLTRQKVSFIEYDKKIAQFRANRTPFNTVLADIKANFGLLSAGDAGAGRNPLLTLSDYELAQIRAAYDKSMSDPKQRSLGEAENLAYGTYEPLSVTLTHILNQKAGIGWTSYAHTGVPVPVFAMGPGQEMFNGFYDNTKVFHNLKALTGVR